MMCIMNLVLLLTTILLASLVDGYGSPMHMAGLEPTGLKPNKNWSEVTNACIAGRSFKSYNEVNSIDICKHWCEKETGIVCQSIQYSPASKRCILSERRSSASNYSEPCNTKGWQYMERLLDSSDGTSRITTAKENYYWKPQEAGDTLWFTTNDTDIILTISYFGPKKTVVRFIPSIYNITDSNIWNKVIYKVEPKKSITICPDHIFQTTISDPRMNITIGFKHSTGSVKWRKGPDSTKAIHIGYADIKNFTGGHMHDEGPEMLFGVPGKWKPTGLPNHFNNWSVTVDLKEIYTLTKLTFKLQGNSRTDIKSFKLEVSNALGSMKEILSEDTVEMGVKESQEFPLPKGSSGRLCRFTVTETVSGEAPIIQDLGFYGYQDCQSSTINSIEDATDVSTLHCNQNETMHCNKPKGTNDKVCTTLHTQVCEDTLICENITKKVCSTSSKDKTPVCKQSSETECKTSTKEFFDEDGCAILLTSKQLGSSGLITSIVFNIILVVIIVVLAVILYFQTGCICNKHNYRKQSLLVGPPTHPPTPPPLMNPAMNRIAGHGMINPRQSDHLYDSPYELPPEDLELRHPQEDSHPGNRITRRGSAHDSVNSFYAAINTNIVENNH